MFYLLKKFPVLKSMRRDFKPFVEETKEEKKKRI
jgi:hypothetical protein